MKYSKKPSVQSVKKFANENNEKVYTKKEIRAMLKNVSRDLLSFEDGEYIIPVKLEVKEFNDKQNTLYVAISLEGIKKTEVSKQGTTENGVAQNSRSVTISIPDLIKKINPQNTNFTKYFPKSLLTSKQWELLQSEKETNTKLQYSKNPFNLRVDDVLSGADNSNTHLEVMDTPEILQKAGIPKLQILMTSRHLKSITADSGKRRANYHGLEVDTVKNLPQYLSDPVMIMDSLTRNDSVVVLTEMVDKKENPIIAAIKINGKGYVNKIEISANILTSAYGKDNFQSFIDRNAEADTVFYWNEKRHKHCSISSGSNCPTTSSGLRLILLYANQGRLSIPN